MTAGSVQDARIPLRVKLSALWAAMMFLYVYADVLSFYRPGSIDEIQRGMMGPVQASQTSLLLAAALVTLPALMIVLSVALAPAWSRGLNLGLGGLYTLVNVGNLVGESWAYYLAFGVVEIAITLTIVGMAWKWPVAWQDARAA